MDIWKELCLMLNLFLGLYGNWVSPHPKGTAVADMNYLNDHYTKKHIFVLETEALHSSRIQWIYKAAQTTVFINV